MKLRIAPAALLLIAGLFAACTRSADSGTSTAAPAETGAAPAASQEAAIETIQGWDFDNRFGGGHSSVIETDAAYYFTAPGGRYLYYYDKASGERGVLCGKPECLHDYEMQNKSCNGYVFREGTLGYWDVRLHYLTYHPGPNGNEGLFSMRLDGTDRRFDTQMSIAIGSTYYSPQRLDYHHGMLYSYCDNEIVHNGVPSFETCIFRMDPETGELKKLYSVETDFQYSSLPSMFYAGKYVYISLDHREKTDDDWITYLDIWRYDIETEEVEDLYHFCEEGYLGACMRIWVKSEDLIYLMPQYMLEDVPGRLYQISGGELRVAVDFETAGNGSISEGVVRVLNPNKRHMEIQRIDGSVIYNGAWELDSLRELLPGAEIEYYISYGSVYGTETELLVSLDLLEKNGQRHCSCLAKWDLTEDMPQATVLAFDPWQ